MVIDSKGKMFEERRKENEKVIDNKRKEDRRKNDRRDPKNSYKA